ncbi:MULTISPECIES: hypothetical protein [unclassified Sphingomonas]|uniref:hypothetical protein n=1 Tax=unclassified Sphingomonas TaxID=196159 RepID=UPI00226AAF91|nr:MULTISPECIES: hypothetical protein [unclassified Sphingomonas]
MQYLFVAALSFADPAQPERAARSRTAFEPVDEITTNDDAARAWPPVEMRITRALSGKGAIRPMDE